MAVTSQADRLRALAAPAVRGAGLVLEELTLTAVGRRRLLRITVDLPEDVRGGVPVDAVATASQAISQVLDTSDVMGEAPYLLEVSSPGADRPLVESRHWKRARGRLVVARLTAGEQVRGRLTDVTQEGVVVAGRVLAWAQLAGGRVEIEFGAVPDGAVADGAVPDGDDPDRDDPGGDADGGSDGGHHDEAEGSA